MQSALSGGEHFPLLAALLILDFGRFSSPQVPDRFVVFQNVFHLIRQVGIDLRQSLGQILVNRAFGNPELFGDCPNRVLRFHDAAAYFNGSLFDVIVHVPASLLEIVWYII